MSFVKKGFDEANKERDLNTGSKADRAMPMESSTGKPLKQRRIPSRDFGYEGARVKFRR